MPKYRCPNCNTKVLIQDYQLGRIVRWGRCAGRFLPDPGLPPETRVEDYNGEPPPVQAPPPPLPPAVDLPWATLEAADPDPAAVNDYASAWALFWVIIATQVIFGAMVGIGLGYTPEDWPRGRVPVLLESKVYLALLVALSLANGVLSLAALFRIARLSRRERDGAAGWIIVSVLTGAIGLALFLHSRPRPGDRPREV